MDHLGDNKSTEPIEGLPIESFSHRDRHLIRTLAEMLLADEYNPIEGISTSSWAAEARENRKYVARFRKDRLSASRFALFQAMLETTPHGYDDLYRKNVVDINARTGALLDEELHEMTAAVMAAKAETLSARAMVEAIMFTDFGGSAARQALVDDYRQEYDAQHKAWDIMVAAHSELFRVRPAGSDPYLTPEMFIVVVTMLCDGAAMRRLIGWPRWPGPNSIPADLVGKVVVAVLLWVLCPPSKDPDNSDCTPPPPDLDEFLRALFYGDDGLPTVEPSA
jgi:hypothetical protein